MLLRARIDGSEFAVQALSTLFARCCARWPVWGVPFSWGFRLCIVVSMAMVSCGTNKAEMHQLSVDGGAFYPNQRSTYEGAGRVSKA